MALTTTKDMFLHQLGDIYDAEHRFLKGQEEMASLATDPQLRAMIDQHIQQSKGQVQILDQVFNLLHVKPRAERCDAAAGLVVEAQKAFNEAANTALRDCLIGGAAAKVEHYEIASYRGLIIGAQMMGQQDIMNLLQQNLLQEEHTAQRLEESLPQLVEKAMGEDGLPASKAAQTVEVPLSTATRTQ